jgi:uncharacterized membrane protein YhhN
MHFYLISFAFSTAALDWVAVSQRWKKLEYIAKPMVILILITWLLIIGGYQGPPIFFLIGLTFSLAGDVLLMLPGERFITGLVSFLIAHLAYTRGFYSAGINYSTGLLLGSILVAIVGIIVLRQILKGLSIHNRVKLRVPVIIYAVVISIMVISSLSTILVPSPSWSIYPASIAIVGAFFFYFSDTILAWNRFVNPFPSGKLVVIIFYHIAQITITLGVGLNFLS